MKQVTSLEKVGLKLNAAKTKVLTTQVQPPKTLTTRAGLEIAVLDQSSSHKWLGCMLSTENAGKRPDDIDHRLQSAARAFHVHKWILCDKVVSMASPLRFFDVMITSVVCFAAGHRKIHTTDLRKLDVHCRKLLRRAVGGTSDEGRGRGRGTRDEGQGTRDKGQGTRDEGRGRRDEGRGTRDEKRGRRDEKRGRREEGGGMRDEGGRRTEEGWGRREEGRGRTEDGGGMRDKGWGGYPCQLAAVGAVAFSVPWATTVQLVPRQGVLPSRNLIASRTPAQTATDLSPMRRWAGPPSHQPQAASQLAPKQQWLGLGPVALHIRSRQYINGMCLEAAW